MPRAEEGTGDRLGAAPVRSAPAARQPAYIASVQQRVCRQFPRSVVRRALLMDSRGSDAMNHENAPEN